MALAAGEKVQDSERRLKKTLKRIERGKEKSKKAWVERKDGVQKSIDTKQKKRTENIKKRIDDKRKKKTKVQKVRRGF